MERFCKLSFKNAVIALSRKKKASSALKQKKMCILRFYKQTVLSATKNCWDKINIDTLGKHERRMSKINVIVCCYCSLSSSLLLSSSLYFAFKNVRLHIQQRSRLFSLIKGKFTQSVLIQEKKKQP